ncbi:hypothetical protein AB0M43_00340 [Longispora sp. NPDC051575]|uniref:hypothetical protein n=1 Tax=Longispora sp. NPDC051575 TaxID=3154943 RepID=UPI00343F6346
MSGTPDSAPESPGGPGGARTFASALDRALKARGLGMDRIQARLARRGLAVSVATLSLWRRGLRQPERVLSLRAVAALEEELGLPPAALSSLLGPALPRGRYVDRPPSGGFGELYRRSASLRQALEDLQLPPLSHHLNPSLAFLSRHLLYELDERGAGHRLREEVVARAITDVHRYFLINHIDEGSGPVAAIRTGPGCRLGRVRRYSELGSVIAELEFDRVLRAGEDISFHHEVSFAPGEHRDHRVAKFFPKPVGLFVCQVRFSPASRPRQVFAYTQDSIDSEPLILDEVRLHHDTATMALQDVRGGLGGLRWQWPEPG